MAEGKIGIIGLGHKLPSHIRRNDDPIFDALKRNQSQEKILKMFQGFDRRHVLTPGEDLVGIMSAASKSALADAETTPAEIDLLLGCASLSRYIVPTDLAFLHRELGLRSDAMALPLGNDFSNFTQGLVLGESLIRSGRVRTVLVVAGGDWTRAVDYNEGASISAADGAGATVLGGSSGTVRWLVLDHEVLFAPKHFGEMYVAGNPIRRAGQPQDQEYSGPYFHLTPAGVTGFHEFGAEQAPLAGNALLARQGVIGKDVTLIGHQASTVLSDAWKAVINPAAVLSTIESCGNMTVASIAVTLSMREDEISTPYVLLLALGLDMHAHAVLLRQAGG
jgi:3-oxoacyl-[acyl-carrier-protein] synthase-3